MSTSGHSMYRPIKVSDILSLGFEKHENEEGKFIIKIHKDKIEKHIRHDRAFDTAWELEGEIKEYDYYYLHLYAEVTHRGHQCVWSFTRYNVNTPALNYFLEGICGMGYKMKVEGERFYYEQHEEYMNFIEKKIKKLSELNNELVSL
jgi:hypothetical protein